MTHHSAGRPTPPLEPVSSAGTLNNGIALSPSYSSPKIAIFEIRFDNDGSAMPALYCSGQVMHITVHLHVKRPLKATCITFHCEGKVRLGNRTKTVVLSEKVVFGSAQSKTHQQLGIGVYDYPIIVQLPANLLPSVTCKGNYVAYQCRATVKRFLKKNDIVIARPFINHHNSETIVSDMAACQGPISGMLTKNSVELSCTANKGACYIGDTVVVSGEVYNKTRSKKNISIGLEIVQDVRVANNIFLGVATLQRWCKHKASSDGQWADPVMVEGRNCWAFSLQLVTGHHLPPTTRHPSAQVSHKLRVIWLCSSKLSLGKPKPRAVELPIIVASPLTRPSSAIHAATPSNPSTSARRLPTLTSAQSAAGALAGGPDSEPPPYSSLCNEELPAQRSFQSHKKLRTPE